MGGRRNFCLSWNHMGMASPNEPSWKDSLELGVCLHQHFLLPYRKLPLDLTLDIPSSKEGPATQSKWAHDKKLKSEGGGPSNVSAGLPVPSHSPLPPPDPGPFSLSPLFKKQVLVRFHSENSEIYVHPPRPEFWISVLQIKGGGD